MGETSGGNPSSPPAISIEDADARTVKLRGHMALMSASGSFSFKGVVERVAVAVPSASQVVRRQSTTPTFVSEIRAATAVLRQTEGLSAAVLNEQIKQIIQNRSAESTSDNSNNFKRPVAMPNNLENPSMSDPKAEERRKALAELLHRINHGLGEKPEDDSKTEDGVDGFPFADALSGHMLTQSEEGGENPQSQVLKSRRDQRREQQREARSLKIKRDAHENQRSLLRTLFGRQLSFHSERDEHPRGHLLPNPNSAPNITS
ncbi:MAG: hypothetical protein Q8R76_04700 [Candidatus Omnitrophota bacterium]|nr:hypothetical protein [Candidatus Omnitrophota bacterium]